MSRIALTCVMLAAALSGCSKLVPKLDEVVPDTRKDYQKAQSLPDLEVPPDLSTEAIKDRMVIPEGGKTAKYSSYQERRAEAQKVAEVEKAQTAAVRVLENEHVLSVTGAPVQVWPKLHDFLTEQGYKLELDDVELGVIETAWAEDQGKLSRDKFKIFAEAGAEAGTTVLYVSHEAQELSPQGEELVWQKKPRDVEAERGMVERLQTFLGGQGTAVATSDDDAAPPSAEARTETAAPSEGGAAAAASSGGSHHADIVAVGGGKSYLSLEEEFPSAWKTTGKALEQVGAQIKDSDKGRGVYLVQVAGGGGEGSGVLSKLKFWGGGDGQELQVSLTGVGAKTEVVVLDRDGRWETGEAAMALLTKLHESFNSGKI